MAVRRRDDEGVSTVLGAILMFALLVITLITVQVKFVPVWDKQREQDTMLEVSKQVNILKADLDRLAANQTASGTANQITLSKAQGFTFFQTSNPAVASLTFTPASSGQGLALSSNQLTIMQANGVQLYGLGEEWTAISATTPISSIVNIEHLRLRLVDPEDTNSGLLTLTLTSGGNCAGRLQIQVFVEAGSDRTIEDRVYGPTSPPSASCNATPITIRDTDAKKQTDPPFYYLDAFDPELHFASVLAAAAYPVTATLTQSVVVGDYTMVYDIASGGGTTRVGGSGLVIPNYSATFPTGTLSVAHPNQRAVPQTYTMEYGAVILQQSDGAVMTVPPAFTVSTGATQASIAWSFPSLVGANAAINSPGGGTVLGSPPSSRTAYQAFAPRLGFTISTAQPALWVDFWTQTLQAAGFMGSVATQGAACTTATVQFSICSTATSATLNVYGPTATPGSTANDLYFTFQQAAVPIALRPSG